MRLLLTDNNGQVIAFANTDNLTVGELAAIPWQDNESPELYAENAYEG